MDVVMPQLGETVTEGTLSAWHVKIGDRVEVEHHLADIESDKATLEIPAPVTGTIAAILVTEGQTVGVGTVLAVIHPETAVDDADAGGENTSDDQINAELNIALPAVPSADTAPLSPAVRRLFVEHDLNAALIQGTGRGGRIRRSDVLEYLQAREHAPVPEPASIEATGKQHGEDATFLSSTRLPQATTEHMVSPATVSSHAIQAVEVDFTAVGRIRTKHGGSWREKTGYALTYLPFIARAVCLAMGDFPRINASVGEGGLRLHPHVNLAIAVDLGGKGLVAPVIKTAEACSVARFADRIHGLMVKAREGLLTGDDLSGATYTIFNSRTFGMLFSAPVISPPQVAVLSTDAIGKRPVVVNGADGDTIAIRYLGILTQSFDHGVIDNAYSAAFLRRVKAIIEESDWLGTLI